MAKTINQDWIGWDLILVGLCWILLIGLGCPSNPTATWWWHADGHQAKALSLPHWHPPGIHKE
jgi:hypothetical protein